MGLKNKESIKRIKKQILSGVYGQLATIIIQIVGPAAMLFFVSPEIYGRWLIISTIPLYLTITDLGIYSAAMVKMTNLLERNEIFSANEVFNSALMFSILVMPAVIIIISGGALFLPANFIKSSEEHLILCMLISVALMAAFYGLIEAIYGSNKLMHKASFYSANGRLFDLIGMTAGVFSGGTLFFAALGIFCARFLFTAASVVNVIKDVPAISWDVTKAKISAVRNLLNSGIYFFLVPISNLILIQGSFLIIAYNFGPKFAAIFSMHRVLGRIIYQVSQVVSKSLSYEVAAFHAKNDNNEIKKLIYEATIKNILICSVIAVIIYYIAPSFLNIWSSGKLSFDKNIYIPLALASFFSAVWMVPSIRLMATENHKEFSLLCLLISISATIALCMAGLAGNVFYSMITIPAADFLTLVAIFLVYKKKGWI